jgi:glycosyltransferase involved in cell wall biosynthesis
MMNKTESVFYSNYSIIVPSYNRQDEIEELLRSFRRLDFDFCRLELIIADDGSSDHTHEVVDSFRSQLPFALHFYSQKNQGPGAARNMGMEKANGDFFIFIDSDCTVPADWLQQIDRQLSLQQADAFGGRDSFRSDFPDLLKAINYSMTSFLTTGGLRGRKGKKFAKFYPRSFNMGLSRQLYQKIGGFGSLRHGQDIEYSHRMIKSGARIIYINEAVVYHKRRTSLKKFFRQVFNWGVARINLYRIDPGMLEPLHAAPAIVTLGLILMVICSILFRPVWFATRWIFALALLVLLISGIHAAIKYRSRAMLYLVPLVMPIQILGYGLGFLLAFLYRVILGKPEFTGFKKKYYH